MDKTDQEYLVNNTWPALSTTYTDHGKQHRISSKQLRYKAAIKYFSFCD
jgi:hypothetical protein